MRILLLSSLFSGLFGWRKDVYHLLAVTATQQYIRLRVSGAMEAHQVGSGAAVEGVRAACTTVKRASAGMVSMVAVGALRANHSRMFSSRLAGAV